MNTTYPKLTTRKCPRCGSKILLVSQVVETVEGQYGPVTTSSYSCSNNECQAVFDRELAKLMKNKEEKDIAQNKRIERLKESRKKTKEKKSMSA